MSDDLRRLLRGWVSQASTADLVWLMLVIAQRCGDGWATFVESWKEGKGSAVLTVETSAGPGTPGRTRQTIDDFEAELDRRDDTDPPPGNQDQEGKRLGSCRVGYGQMTM
ncbi:MAG: hypothetical protein OEV73_00015 [Desulfobulbaceae bacterium]|nr:hypothetical protein [Desulfobulbaceae bacterium]